MLAQESNIWTDFLSKIIGSFLATLGAFLTWYIIEIYKKKAKKKGTGRVLNRLYKIFQEKTFYDNITADVLDLLDDLGTKYILKILKMHRGYIKPGYRFEGSLFSILGIIKHGEKLLIEQQMNYFSFKKPNENKEIYQNFMSFFLNQCKKNKFKIKNTENNKSLFHD